MKPLILLFAAVLIFGRAHAQENITICGATSTDLFAGLASTELFRHEHAEPLPYTHRSKVGKMISYNTPDGKTARAYLLEANVDTDDYLLVLHEWWGLNGYIKKEAEKYYDDLKTVNVLALDLYDGKVAETSDKASEYVQQLDNARVVAIIQGALDYVGNSSEIATIGWCFGGGWALQAAMMAGSEAQGAVMYYGMPEKDPQRIKELINFPVMGIFATKDSHITWEIVNDFKENMEKASKQLIVHFYEANHAFANPSNPKYNREAASDAYKKSLAFLKRVLD